MSAKPKVSICIPTYNQAEFLPIAVESALSQDYDSLEVVISENHSTDETPDYVSSLKDSRIRVVRPERHLSLCGNFRFSFSQSRGNYVTFLPSDDVLMPGYVIRLAQVLDDHPTASYAYCATQLINEFGTALGTERHVGGSFFKSGLVELKRSVYGHRGIFSSVMTRRESYNQAGGFTDSGSIVGDWDLILRLLQVGDVAYHDEVLAQYRVWNSPERDSRIIGHIRDIVELYETTVADIIKSHPDFAPTVTKARRSSALSYALGLGGLAGKPEFDEAASQVRRIYDSAGVRLRLRFHKYGLSGFVRMYIGARNWLRLKVKALIYLVSS